MSGIYIHIPFCKSRCVYCGFFSSTSLELRSRYVDALCRELRLRSSYLTEPVTTIYFGGGTPSLLLREEVEKIFEALLLYNKVEMDAAEITIECNPDDMSDEFARQLAALPFNRVSIGAQSFNDELLRFMRRRHSAGQISRAVERIHDAGIANISIDLMFGFPEQTVEQWCDDISKALKLGVKHISSYSLMYEEGTPLYSLLLGNKIEEISDETYLAMYNELTDRLASAGFEHYEISNFALPGFRSRHNSSYWQGIPYLGAGAGAHSFDISSRQWNVEDIPEYIASISKGEVLCEREVLSKDMKFDDTVTTSLRTREGISLSDIRERFGEDYYGYLLGESKRHIADGNLIIEGGRLRLTRAGLFISDRIMTDLMHV